MTDYILYPAELEPILGHAVSVARGRMVAKNQREDIRLLDSAVERYRQEKKLVKGNNQQPTTLQP